MFFIFIAVEDRWAFDFAELFIDVNMTFNPWFKNKTMFEIRKRWFGNNETRAKYDALVLNASDLIWSDLNLSFVDLSNVSYEG